ncbi:unnamed protein product [Prorocentrum cordatum]|uniref:Exonuclease domain-containing protein n=1 Tax=Prorocentrum cordatum TaxID=2364126 RepID=A0ABN9PI56_9DINO|nr:unnamed protein product [Polarella glacialis]
MVMVVLLFFAPAIRRGPGSALQPAPMDYLVVLDFEWTADNRRPMLPVSEITQFPSVLVRLDGRRSAVVDEFNAYVRPTLNPTLTAFSIELTGITQRMVDRSEPLREVIAQYLSWLQSHQLIEGDSHDRIGRWAFCTWSDADVGSQLVRELRHKEMPMPACFDRWIDLKVLYRRHYKKEPTGGLRACVERLGLTFEGRAHDGLVDSRNTASIALHMARGSMLHGAFVFRRPTRGLDQDGNPFGSAAGRAAKRRREEHARARDVSRSGTEPGAAPCADPTAAAGPSADGAASAAVPRKV